MKISGSWSTQSAFYYSKCPISRERKLSLTWFHISYLLHSPILTGFFLGPCRLWIIQNRLVARKNENVIRLELYGLLYRTNNLFNSYIRIYLLYTACPHKTCSTLALNTKFSKINLTNDTTYPTCFQSNRYYLEYFKIICSKCKIIFWLKCIII